MPKYNMNEFEQLGCDCISSNDDIPKLGLEPFMDQCHRCNQPFYQDCWYTRPASKLKDMNDLKPKTSTIDEDNFQCKICLKKFRDEDAALAGDHGIRRNFERINCHDLYVHTTRGGNRKLRQKVPGIRVNKV